MAAGKPPSRPKKPTPFVPPPEWLTYKKQPGLVLGFHGCDKQTAGRLLSGKTAHLKSSTNEYDWLGSGIYFWESDPWRALKFAQEATTCKHLTRGVISEPYVIGAIIDLGLCFNLLEIEALEELQGAHEYLNSVYGVVHDKPMPKNTGRELGARFLDKAVVEFAHSLREKRGLTAYDSVRSAFIEGTELYAGAGFRSRNHIQIAVRNPTCIKGYFRLPGM